MKLLNLFIDELGQSNPKAPNAGVYILSGCIVDKVSREDLKIKADQIKFKYWDKTNIVFHSREIGRKEGVFTILQDKKVEDDFYNNLFYFLNEGRYKMFFVVVDLKKACNKNWNTTKVYEETSLAIIKNFILSLLSSGDCRGRIVIESATSQKDFYFHKAVSYFLSAGFPELKIPFTKIQEVMTEISFVTKKNFDIEEQIADLLAYGAKLKFLKSSDDNFYKTNIIKVLNNKLFVMHPNTGVNKRKYQSKIEGFKILP